MIGKVEKWLFCLFILLAPLSVRKILIFWGISFNEWTAAFLYGTDLLIALLLFLGWWREGWGWPKVRSLKIRSANFWLASFFLVALLSLLKADNQALGWYRLIKLGEFIAFYFYLRGAVGKVFSIDQSFLVLVWSGFFQAAIAIGQAFKQGSLGWSWLGESILRGNIQGVANFLLAGGEKWMRAYGLLPHPNILAAWLFLAIFAFYFWYLYRFGEKDIWLAILVYPILVWGLLLTFSRVIIGLFLVGLLVRFLLFWLVRRRLSQEFRRRAKVLVITSLAAVAIFAVVFWPQTKARFFWPAPDQSISDRLLYNGVATKVIEKDFGLGLGLGQFVWDFQRSWPYQSAYFYQPVHNIYLLIASEMGLVGLAVFLIFLTLVVLDYRKRVNWTQLSSFSVLIIFGSLLMMGLTDHFLWTIQQGQIMFWSMLGFMSSFKN